MGGAGALGLARRTGTEDLMKKFAILSFTSLLTACTTGEPVVSSYNGSSVSIQQVGYAEASAATISEANRICGIDGRKAELASLKAAPAIDPINPNVEYLFLCVNR